MRKFLVYGLVTVVIGGLGVAFNSWEYKGSVKAREFDMPQNISSEVSDNSETSKTIEVKAGETLEIDIENAKVNFKYHSSDKVLVESIEGIEKISYDENEKNIIISENNNINRGRKVENLTITLPKDANFNLDIKTNDSNVSGEIGNIKNLCVKSDKGFADIKINKVDNVDVNTGYGNVGLAINEVKGQITGNVRVGSVNFDIENEEKINLNGYKVYSDNKIIRVNETIKGNQNVDIKGDLGKVIFN